MKKCSDFYDFVQKDLWVCFELARAWTFHSTSSKLSEKLGWRSDFMHLQCTTRNVLPMSISQEMEAIYALKEDLPWLLIVIDKEQRKVKKMDEGTLYLVGSNAIELKRYLII